MTENITFPQLRLAGGNEKSFMKYSLPVVTICTKMFSHDIDLRFYWYTRRLMKMGSSKKSPSGTSAKTSGVTVVVRTLEYLLCTVCLETRTEIPCNICFVWHVSKRLSDSRLLRHLALVRFTHLWYIYIGFGLQILVRKNFISTNEKARDLRKVKFCSVSNNKQSTLN